MNKRFIFGLTVITICAYLAGLLFFMPPDRMKQWLQTATQGRLTWHELSLGWEGIRFSKLRVTPPIFSPDQEIDYLVLRPQLWPLFSLKLGVKVLAKIDLTFIDSELSWNNQTGRLAWRVKLEDLTRVTTTWMGPLAKELQGKGEGNGWLSAKNTPPWIVDGGEWEMQLKGLTAFGAKIEPFTLNGLVKEKGIMEIKLSGKGDLAIAGKLTMTTQLPDIRTSPVNGELQIQPIKPNLGGMVGQFLAKGQAVKMILSGTMGNIQWRIQ